jgi:rfaE bifunctional protein kinase chain/domain
VPSLEKQRVEEILQNCHGKRIAVVGDVMIDRYFWGAAHRISPEAPVPVVEVEKESVRFGGAANVANNIQILGGTPLLVGLVGNDHPGKMFHDMLVEQGLDFTGIVVDGSRPTTIKTRVIAQGQHVVRIDNESKLECPDHLRHRIVDAVRYNIHSLDAIIIEDYNKGVVTREVIQEIIAVAKKYNKIVTVDPKFNNFFEYKNVTVFKPNRREAEEVLGGRLRTDGDVEAAGKKLLAMLGAQNVLLTRSEQGMTLVETSGMVTHLPSMAQVVRDVSGAGDTVISTLTLVLAAGATIREACMMADCAGGIVVGSIGIVPVLPEELKAGMLSLAADGKGKS